MPRALGSPSDFTDSLLRAVGQPTIFGTPLVVLLALSIKDVLTLGRLTFASFFKS